MKFTAYILAGCMALTGIGCRGEGRHDPISRYPVIFNPHPNLFSEVSDDYSDMLDGDIVTRLRWYYDRKSDTGGVDQMKAIENELGSGKVSGYNTRQEELFLRVENDDIPWATDSNGDGTRDFAGKITSGNRLAIDRFREFYEFATGIISYDDAVQYIQFLAQENVRELDDIFIYGIGNNGLHQSLPGIGNVRADVIIRWKDGDIDTFIFDTSSTPIDTSPAGDLDKLEQYFSTFPNSIGNLKIHVFTDNHTNDVNNRLGGTKELRRFELDESLNH